jgi:GTP cyclohydrolase I
MNLAETFTASTLINRVASGYAPCDCDEDDAPASTASPVDYQRIERAVREILIAVGENPDREGLLETPARVARMYAEIFSGLHTDPAVHLRKMFTQAHDEMVLVKDIEFASCCEHHLVPFLGKAHIAYLPAGKVVGLSKLARVVDGVAKRPQVQERMTEEIAELIMSELQPRGVGVILEATHMCMTIRGVKKANASTVTSAMRGLFRTNPMTRGELMALVYGGK